MEGLSSYCYDNILFVEIDYYDDDCDWDDNEDCDCDKFIDYDDEPF